MRKRGNTVDEVLQAQISCYVCSKVIKLGAVYIGSGLYRHDLCFPGSARWLRSETGRKSELRRYFEVKS